MIHQTSKIAFLITTFLRDELLYQSIESLLSYLQDNWIILIADQGNISEEKKKWILKLKQKYPDNLHYRQVSFNSGLSYGRNYLINLAKEKNCEYVVLASDNFLFNKSIQKIDKIVDFLKSNNYYDLIGFELENCICNWEAKLNLIKNEYFELDFINTKSIMCEYYAHEFNNYIKIFDCDIVRNFFVAKIDGLLNTKWDNNLKCREHEDFFWRYKQLKYKVGWTNQIYVKKLTDRPKEYDKYRKGNMYFGLNYLKNKYKIKKWIKYINVENMKNNAR
jgi:hypothetical protein